MSKVELPHPIGNSLGKIHLEIPFVKKEILNFQVNRSVEDTETTKPVATPQTTLALHPFIPADQWLLQFSAVGTLDFLTDGCLCTSQETDQLELYFNPIEKLVNLDHFPALP